MRAPHTHVRMDRAELERLHPESWGWALACCARDRDLAHDALQSAYLRILSGKARYHGRSSFKTWLFGVIRLTALEEMRRDKRWTDLMDDDLFDPAPGADVLAESSELSAGLVAALATLSARQREVLHLVFYHDMSIEEAATVMNVSIGSARTHYDRGKKALARELTRPTGRGSPR
jgi:RNA polymerase sigma-70 factor, ECF subfamily